MSICLPMSPTACPASPLPLSVPAVCQSSHHPLVKPNFPLYTCLKPVSHWTALSLSVK
jgi:hypothetical protein